MSETMQPIDATPVPVPATPVTAKPAGPGFFGSIWNGIKSAGSWVGNTVANGAKVVATDVGHAADFLGSVATGAIVPFLGAYTVPALKGYLLSGGALNVTGIVAVTTGSILAGLWTIVCKSTSPVAKAVVASVQDAQVQAGIQKLATTIGNDAQKGASAAEAALANAAIKVNTTTPTTGK